MGASRAVLGYNFMPIFAGLSPTSRSRSTTGHPLAYTTVRSSA